MLVSAAISYFTIPLGLEVGLAEFVNMVWSFPAPQLKWLESHRSVRLGEGFSESSKGKTHQPVAYSLARFTTNCTNRSRRQVVHAYKLHLSARPENSASTRTPCGQMLAIEPDSHPLGLLYMCTTGPEHARVCYWRSSLVFGLAGQTQLYQSLAYRTPS
jgi:hypothetical protein